MRTGICNMKCSKETKKKKAAADMKGEVERDSQEKGEKQGDTRETQE